MWPDVALCGGDQITNVSAGKDDALLVILSVQILPGGRESAPHLSVFAKNLPED